MARLPSQAGPEPPFTSEYEGRSRLASAALSRPADNAQAGKDEGDVSGSGTAATRPLPTPSLKGMRYSPAPEKPGSEPRGEVADTEPNA